MQIYLPIAEMSVNVLVMLGLGAGIGVVSGLFGVGGGFLLTPLLLLVGVPAAVAVSTQAPQIVGSSLSGVLAYWKRGAVDVKMGLVLTAGGLVGSVIGVQIFAWLRALGQVEFVIKVLYVVFLGLVGGLMAIESLSALRRARALAAGGLVSPAAPKRRRWIHRLPFKLRFKQSHLYISALPPLAIGLVIGVLGAVMGVGGGVVMLPAMIYLLGMPTSVVVGTSLFQIMIVMAVTTVLHAIANGTVDAMLAVLLLVGSVIGAQLGALLAGRLRGEQLRLAFAVLVLVVCLTLLVALTAPPAEPFSVSPAR